MGLVDDALNAFRAGDTQRAERLARELLVHARAGGDAAAEVDGLCMLARVALRQGQTERVAELAGAARGVARQAGRVALERMPLHLQAVASRLRGDLATARRLYEDSVALNKSLGEERMVAAEFHNLGYVELRDGHPERARALFAQARTEALRLDHRPLFPYLIGDAAVMASESQDYERAARLAGAASAAFLAAEQVPDPDDAAEQERLREALTAALGQLGFRAAFDAGAVLTVEEALAETD